MDDLKQLITESFLSEEMKTSYLNVLPDMTDEEKQELRGILEEGKVAKAKHDEERLEKLARLNAALEIHLQKTLREEQKYARDEFENLDKQSDTDELNNLEQQINTL